MSVAGFRFSVVPHTHWDREWYLPLEHFRLQLADRVDELLDVLERDRRFRVFTLDGQAVLLEDYVELRPEQEERLRALLRAGRLSVGPSYVLPDELLVGGESLVRNLLLGRAVCERFGARPSGVGYMPDSFGHPTQLPQILRGFGIESFLFSRGMGDELDSVGRVFRWVAPDGSAVTALNLPGHYDSAVWLRSGDDLAWRAGRVVELYGADLARAGVRDVVLTNGSDHVPVQPELPGWLRRAARLTGAPFRLASFDEYAASALPRRLPELRGELLGSREQNVLRGVNSARMYLKQANERAERLLLSAETAAVLADLAGCATFPAADFRFAWRELLRNHPHDSICGCSVDEVHDDMLERYARLERTVSVLERRAMAAFARAPLADSSEEFYRPVPRATLTVLNPLPWTRRRLLRVELPAELRRGPLAAELGGEPVAVDRDGGAALVAVEVGGFAAAQLALRRGDAPSASNTVLLAGGDARTSVTAGRSASPRVSNTVLQGRRKRPSIASDRHHVEAAADGTVRVVDLAAGREVSGMLRFEDEPDLGDLYNFCPDADATVWRSDGRGVERSARVLRSGPLFSELELATRGPVALRTMIRLVAGGDRVEVETEVDNRARDHRLRVVLPAPRAGAAVRAEGQFAVIRRPLRPPRPRTRWVEPPDPTQHTLGAVALGDLALFTKGLPEYEARGPRRDAEIALTLLRCVGLISRPDGLPIRRYGAGPATPTPGGQCPGRHRFEYAFRLDAQALSDAELLRAGQDYRFDLLTGPAGSTPPTPIGLDGDPVAFSCLKGAENGDGILLRVFSPGPDRAQVSVRTGAAVSRTRLDETGDRPLSRRAASVRPGGIVTFRIK
jgi:alpha-mannosidase